MTCIPASLLLVLASCGVAVAQGDGERETLPPVTAAPPQQTGEGGALSTNQNDPAELFDLPFSYPSLSQELLTGGADALRATRSIWDDPRNISVVREQLLTERQADDLGQAIQTEVGVMVQRTGRGQASPFIRGLTGQQILILVDGIRLTNSFTRAGPNQYFSLIDPGMVEEVQIVRGPGSVQWGSDAIGGVINVVTRSPEFIGGDYLSPGTIQRFSTADNGYYGRVNVEGFVNNVGVFGGGGYGDFHNIDLGGEGGRQPATSFNQNAGDIKFSYLVDRCSQVIVSLQHFEQDDLFRTDRFEQGDQRVFGPQSRDLAYLRYQGLNPLGTFFHSWTLTGSYNFMNQVETRRNSTTGNATEQSVRSLNDDQFGLNLVFGADYDQYGRVTYGFDWYHEDLDSAREDTDLTTGVSTSKPGDFPNDGYYSRFGGFLEWDVQLTDRLAAISGVRYSYIAAGATITAGAAAGHIDPTYDDWSSSIGLVYDLHPGIHLVGSVAEGFRAPNLEDLAATNTNTFAGTDIPNPNLVPERSINYEIGLKFDTPKFRSQAFVFWTDISNHILRQPEGNPLNPNFALVRENRNTRLQGVEWAGEYLLHSGWSLYGNISYIFGQDLSVAEPLSRIPPLQGVLGVRWRERDGAQWFDMYTWLVGRQDRLSARDMTDTVRIPVGGTPGFGTLNLRYGYLISRGQRLSLSVLNVTDSVYQVHGSGAKGPGIDLVLGYELLQ
jgi:outer membrane receptor protein involved in Fe transport